MPSGLRPKPGPLDPDFYSAGVGDSALDSETQRTL